MQRDENVRANWRVICRVADRDAFDVPELFNVRRETLHRALASLRFEGRVRFPFYGSPGDYSLLFRELLVSLQQLGFKFDADVHVRAFQIEIKYHTVLRSSMK